MEAEQARQDALLRDGQALTVILSYQVELMQTVAQAREVLQFEQARCVSAAAALQTSSETSSAAAAQPALMPAQQQQQQLRRNCRGLQSVTARGLSALTSRLTTATTTTIDSTATSATTSKSLLPDEPSSSTFGSIDVAVDDLEQQLSLMRWSEPDLEVAEKLALQLQQGEGLNLVAGLSGEPSSSASGIAQSSLQSTSGALRQLLEKANMFWTEVDWTLRPSQLQ